MDPFITGSIIQGGTQLGGGLFNLGQAKKQRIHERNLAEYGYQKDLEMWNLQNEYNDPANQLKRLTDAGINPNMALGGNNISGNATGTIPKYQVPEQHFPAIEIPQVLSMMNQYQDLKVKSTQADLITANVREQEITNNYLESYLNGRNTGKWLDVGMDQYRMGLTRQDISKTNDGLAFPLKDNSPFALKTLSESRKYQADATSSSWTAIQKEIETYLMRHGIKDASPFVKMMTLKQAGWNASQALPYIIGEALGNLAGKVIGNIRPYGFNKFSGKAKLDTKRYSNPSRQTKQYYSPGYGLEPNTNFY